MKKQTEMNGVCASCGVAKKASHPLCNNCFYTLPRDSRRFLYAFNKKERNAALAAAVDWLATHRHWKAERGKNHVR